MKKHRYDNAPAYRKWVKARDRALEDLHTRAQREHSDQMRALLSHVLMLATSHYHDLKDPARAHLAIDQFQHQAKEMFRMGAQSLLGVFVRMRVRAFVLAKTSEGEILAQLNPGKSFKTKIDRTDIERVRKASMDDGKTLQRISLYMDRLSRRVTNQVQTAALNAPDLRSFQIDVLQAFPKKKIVTRPQRILKPALMEAKDDIPKVDFAIDLIDEDQWHDMLDAYKQDYVPTSRAPEFVVDFPTKEKDEWYAWEFERDLSQEFVQSVRDGQIEAAKDNGITDFVWIAVIDAVTDECCRWRDGLLISEIEAQLQDHQDEDEECRLDGDGLVPPIHFNCRCTLAPATENIPDKPDDGAKDFEQWLES